MPRTIWSRQPIKAVCFALFYAAIIPYLLLLCIAYLIRSLRPVPQWSIRRCLGRAYLKSFFRLLTITRHQGGTQLTVPKEKDRLVVIEPPPNEYFSGILSQGNVQPAKIRALWFPSPPPTPVNGGRRIILHLPGSGFVLPLATNAMGQDISDILTDCMDATVLFTAYRLAKDSSSRFPAALQDGLSSYHYILALGVAPEDIVLSGDSAGGNIVLAMMRYLEGGQRQLPWPRGAMVYSPAVYITADAGQDYRLYNNSDVDTLLPSFCQWAADSYLPERGTEYTREATPYFSPLHHPFPTKVPLFIHAGGKESLHDGIKSFSEQMSRIQGNRIKFHVSDIAPHDIMIAHRLLGYTDEAKEAVRDANSFFEKNV